MTPRPPSPETPPTPHELVQELEASIARRAAADSTQADLAHARELANAIIADARTRGDADAKSIGTAITEQARVQAQQTIDDGIATAAEITATAALRLDRDVATVLERVLPMKEVD